MTDHDLDDLKARLHRCFGVQVHRDLQVRAEIIIQPEAGRWLFTPAELGELLGRPQRHPAHLKAGRGMALPSHAHAIHRAVHTDLSWPLALGRLEPAFLTSTSGAPRSRGPSPSPCRSR